VTRNAHDLLLEWLSECCEGSWQRFRDAHEWLFGARGPRPSTSARTLTTLGHMEIAWDAGVWTASVPVLTLLPSAGAHALLTGGRTRALQDRVRQIVWHEDADNLYLQEQEQEHAPTAFLVSSDDESAIEALADHVGIHYQRSVSELLSRALPRLESYLALSCTTPVAKGYGVERFNPKILTWDHTGSDREPGLYRYEVPGPPTFRLLDDDGRLYAPDLAIGVYAALARWAGDVLRYHPESINGTLAVPIGAPLPTLQARAAALCSGLAPQRRGKMFVYWNVPLEIAERIAFSLGQTLIVN
jgi:hypothetical protein